MSEAAAAGPKPATQAGIGAFLLLLAVALWVDALRLPAPPTVGVGPAAAMRLVSVIVAVLGIAHAIAAWRRRGEPGGAAAHGNRAALAWVLGALIGLIVILQFGGGFVVGATWLFVATARAFGERLGAKPVLIGLLLSGLVYVFFTKALSLALPAGPIERLLG